jgi:hypothetical protein
MRLSGRIDEIPVEFVAESIVREQTFKFTTQSEGRVMMIVDETPGSNIAVVVGDDTVPQVPRNIRTLVPAPPAASARGMSIDGILTHLPSERRAEWLRARGSAHIDRIKENADEIARAFATIEQREIGNLALSYGRFGTFGGRGKSVDSVLTKLLRKDFEAFERGQPGIDSLNRSIQAIGDGIGARLTFGANASGVINPHLVQEFVDQIVIDIRNGNRVIEIMNYRPRNSGAPPYLTDAQIQQIVRADADFISNLRQTAGPSASIPAPIVVRNTPNDSSASGYTAFHMNILYRSGVQAEFQARGPAVTRTAEVGHIFYDINAGKPLAERYLTNPAFARAAEDYRRLPEAQRELFNRYIEQRMIYARRIESGEISASTAAPQLPQGLPPSISLDNLAPNLSN